MSDIFTRKKRSEIMRNINSKSTKLEVRFRTELWKKGYRYTINDKRYIGKPDVVLPKFKTMIFIHGCFWHGHICKKGNLPKTNLEFWKEKIQKNRARDESSILMNKSNGWEVLVIWGCEVATRLKLEEKIEDTIKKLVHE